MSKVLVVGGAGYIGSHANKLFTAKGYKTVVFDNLSTGHRRLAALLKKEELAERAKDVRYWAPLKKELEALRLSRERA